jgi:hypothetical protein
VARTKENFAEAPPRPAHKNRFRTRANHPDLPLRLGIELVSDRFRLSERRDFRDFVIFYKRRPAVLFNNFNNLQLNIHAKFANKINWIRDRDYNLAQPGALGRRRPKERIFLSN